ncbi:MAG: CbtA family protein [Burkholderiales bacterium]
MSLTGSRTFRHIAVSALLAGLLTGVPMTFVQMFTTSPLIAQAEAFENSAAVEHASSSGAQGSHDHGNSWEPGEGLERTLYTGLSTVLAAIGYALILAVVLAQLKRSGWRQGLLLGAAGYVVFQLAPGLGLPPQPPGVPEAELMPRQTWWFGTVTATALGLGALYWARTHSKAIWILVGVVLLVAPHVIGAPQAVRGISAVPQSLAEQFAVVALLTMGAFWLLLGSIEGLIFSKLSRR